MSGKKQHYIWQHIQRGFAKREFSDDHLWVYRKSENPERTVSRNYGAEKYFYGAEGSIADDNITSYENNLQELITKARSAPDQTRVDSIACGLLVTKLEIRSAFIRAEFSRVLDRLLMEMRDFLKEPRVLSEMLQSYVRSQPVALTDELKKLGTTTETSPFLLNLLVEAVPSLVDGEKSRLPQVAEDVIGPLLRQVAEVARVGHIRALERDFSQTDRTLAHQEMIYSVRKSPEEDLILPDTGVAFLIGLSARPLSQKDDKIEQILIPIDSVTLIVGSRKNPAPRSTKLINSILASCSFDSFAAKDQRSEFTELSRKIGKNAKMLDDAEIRRIVRTFRFDNAFDQQA